LGQREQRKTLRGKETIMAFGGAAVQNPIGEGARGRNILEITGLTLGAPAGAFNIANADSGRLTTDQTPPANETAVGATFGPGEGAWTQDDVDAVTVVIHNAVVAANVRVELNGKNLTAGNLEVDIHAPDAGGSAPGAVTLRLIYEHSAIR
jgi:hypothetical protein